MREEQLLEHLLNRFPDGKIVNVSTIDNYYEINKLANEKNMSTPDFLRGLGFDVAKKGSWKEEEALERLLELFPDGKIENVSGLDCYYEINKLANDKNMNVPDFLIGLGFDVVRRGTWKEEEALEKLLELFPNRKVFSLQEHGSLYRSVQKFAREKGTELVDYLREYGFEVVRRPKQNNAIPVELAIQEKELYIGKTKYDEVLMKRLIDDYNFVASDFSESFGVSRQAVLSKMQRVKHSAFDWKVKQLPKEHMDVFETMINDEIAKRETETHRYFISHNAAEKDFIFSVFPRDVNDFPMSWEVRNLDERLHTTLLNTEYHIFSARDLSTLYDIRNSPQDTYDNNSGNLYNSFRNLANKHINYYNFELESSALYDDFDNRFAIFAATKNIPYNKKEDNRRISDDEIREVFQRFYNPESGTVKIPIEDSQYHRFIRLASIRGYSFKEFVESYGFKYKRFREDFGHDGKKLKQRMIERLKNYKVTDDTVYISSYTKLYAHLTNIGRLKGMNLTEYLLSEYNLKRMEFKDLPADYSPYELGDSEEDLDTEERFLRYIENHLIIDEEKSTFYIDSSSKFYAYILKYCNLVGIAVDDFFKKWELNKLNYYEALDALKVMGFSSEEADSFLNKAYPDFSDDEGVEAKPADDTTVESEEPDETNSEGDSIVADTEETTQEDEGIEENEVLKKLAELSTQVKDTTVELAKKTRSQELVRLMKELYDNKCQLCNPENPIPVILMKNGEAYVEMHHIIALANSSVEDETDLILDDYQNAVVVCSHHHKVLHYHQGGFTEIDELIDGLYFVNDETEVKIYTNKHLQIRFS